MNMEKIGDLRREKKISRKTVKGFTLLELIVAMAIIGILAAISSGLITGYVRDRKFETCNEYARLTYTAMQNALIQSEIKQDFIAFDAKAIDGNSSTKGGTAPDYVSFVLMMNNGEFVPEKSISVTSYYGSSTGDNAVFLPSTVWDFSNNKLKSGLTDEKESQGKAFKFLKNYFEGNLSADFTGTIQVFVDYRNYQVDAVVYNDALDNEITYLKKYYIDGSTAQSLKISIMYGEEDIFTQKETRNSHGEFYGCYPMMNDLGKWIEAK